MKKYVKTFEDFKSNDVQTNVVTNNRSIMGSDPNEGTKDEQPMEAKRTQPIIVDSDKDKSEKEKEYDEVFDVEVDDVSSERNDQK